MPETVEQSPAIGNEFAKKLAQSVKTYSDEAQKKYRDNRKLIMQSYAGKMYGLADAFTGQPLNLVHQMVNSIVPVLRLDPKPSVTTRVAEYRAFAERTKLALGFIMGEVEASAVFHAALKEAILGGRGVVMTGISPAGKSEAPNYLDDPGRQYLRNVWDHNYVCDMSAEDADAVAFRGHRFRVPFEWAIESGLYDKGELERLRKAQTEKHKERKPFTVPGEAQDELLECVELMTLWLPSKNVLVTLPGDTDLCDKFLREDKYYGPESGPYTELTFSTVPGSTMPISLVGVVYDLVKMINGMTEKISDGAKAFKRFVMVKPGADRESSGILQVQHGGVLAGDPSIAKEVSLGGVDDTQYKTVGWLYDWFNRGAKNPDLMGGTRAQSNTATQDKLLFDSASVGMSELRGVYREFQTKTLRKLAWYLWNDTEANGLNIRLLQNIGGGVDLPVRWTPDEREGDFGDYTFDVESYSAAGQSPDEQYARFKDFLTSVYLPLIPAAAQQGQLPNVSKAIEVGGAMIDLDGVDDFFTTSAPQQVAATQAPSQSGSNVTMNMGKGQPASMIGGVSTPQGE